MLSHGRAPLGDVYTINQADAAIKTSHFVLVVMMMEIGASFGGRDNLGVFGLRSTMTKGMKKYPASLFTDIGVLGDVVEHVMAA
jgi:hypothetical protein